MRKFICLLIAILVCASVALPVFAAEDDFVPSIEYKDGPEVSEGTMGEDDVTDCLIVTTIEQAKEGSTDISKEERDLLLEIYDKILKGELELPLDYDYTILELLDISFKYKDCVTDKDHENKEEILDQEGTTIVVDFDVEIPDGSGLKILVYVDGAWEIVENVVVNEDGSVTAEFEKIGPVAFVVDEDFREDIPQTGDRMGNNIVLWVSLLALSAAVLTVLGKACAPVRV